MFDCCLHRIKALSRKAFFRHACSNAKCSYCIVTLGPEGYMPFDSVAISKLATKGREILKICVYPHRLQKRPRSHFDLPAPTIIHRVEQLRSTGH